MISDSDRPSSCLSRRAWLQAAALAASGSLLPQQARAAVTATTARSTEQDLPPRVIKLSEHVWLYQGAIHVGIVHDNGKALLIDCGDGSVCDALEQLGIDRVETVLYTHYHRDQLCGDHRLPTDVDRRCSAKERDYLADPMVFWRDDQYLDRVYRSFRPDHRLPIEPVMITKALEGDATFAFGPAKITVLNTPGHTAGSVSYLVEVDGQRFLFCGDLLAGDGQLWDLYSLQQGFSREGQTIGGYHGFMGDRPAVQDSLEQVCAAKPDLVVPSHGSLISDAEQARSLLTLRLEQSYENYVSISALRHYFPKLFTDYAGKPGQMPIRPGIEPPDCLRHFGTTWMLLSSSGAAIVMDAGSPRIVEQVQQMLAAEEIKSVEGLWVTHYHHDHTDGIPAFQAAFDCPCLTDRRLADVLVAPKAWRLPCLMPEPIRVDRPLNDGQTWTWHEFKLTSFFYPGQTLYHAALLAERDDLRMLFVGDSHTPSGLDDYCAFNRNLLGRDVGFHYCLSLIEKLQPTHLFNCHVDQAFTFTADEIAFMRQQLDAREHMFGKLTPWPHANFATDPSWVRMAPYRQPCTPGQAVNAAMVITNHSSVSQQVAGRLRLPRSWDVASPPWQSLEIPGKAEQRLAFSVPVPADASPGRIVVDCDVRLGDLELPSFTECVLEVMRSEVK